MHCDTSFAIQIHFLEDLNLELRQKAATISSLKETTARHYFPMFVVSGLASISAWSLSWIS